MPKKSKGMHSDSDFINLISLYNRLKLRYPDIAILDYLAREVLIPCSIFSRKISSLETIVKYLVENRGFNLSRIADLLNRSSKTIWQAYNSAAKKHPPKFLVEESMYFFPLGILRARKLSVLESIVVYLRDELGLSNKEIADLLKRSSKTIWTCYSRAKKKSKR